MRLNPGSLFILFGTIVAASSATQADESAPKSWKPHGGCETLVNDAYLDSAAKATIGQNATPIDLRAENRRVLAHQICHDPILSVLPAQSTACAVRLQGQTPTAFRGPDEWLSICSENHEALVDRPKLEKFLADHKACVTAVRPHDVELKSGLQLNRDAPTPNTKLGQKLAAHPKGLPDAAVPARNDDAIAASLCSEPTMRDEAGRMNAFHCADLLTEPDSTGASPIPGLDPIHAMALCSFRRDFSQDLTTKLSSFTACVNSYDHLPFTDYAAEPQGTKRSIPAIGTVKDEIRNRVIAEAVGRAADLCSHLEISGHESFRKSCLSPKPPSYTGTMEEAFQTCVRDNPQIAQDNRDRRDKKRASDRADANSDRNWAKETRQKVKKLQLDNPETDARRKGSSSAQ